MENESYADTRSVALMFVGFLGFPVLFTGYNLLVRSVWWGRSLELYAVQAKPGQILIAVIALGEIGVLLAIGHGYRLRIARWWALFVVTFVPLVSGPILPGEAKSETGYILFSFGLIGVTAVVEAILKQRGREQLTDRARRAVVIIATGHAIGGVVLQLFARGTDVFVDEAFTFTIPVVLSVGVFFLLTAVAVLLREEAGLATPLVATLGWFLWAVGGIVASGETLPAGGFQGVDYSALAPYPDYLLSWPMLLLLLVLTVLLEWGLRVGHQSFRNGRSRPQL